MTDHEVAANLVLEDDGTQHFTNDGALHVYSPRYGTMHIERVAGGGWRVKHAQGMLPPGWFYDTIGFGPTLATAIARAAGLPESNAVDKFAERVLPWAQAATDHPTPGEL